MLDPDAQMAQPGGLTARDAEKTSYLPKPRHRFSAATQVRLVAHSIQSGQMERLEANSFSTAQSRKLTAFAGFLIYCSLAYPIVRILILTNHSVPTSHPASSNVASKDIRISLSLDHEAPFILSLLRHKGLGIELDRI